MPDFWEFPTVSMGLAPIMAIYQARFNKYLQDRGIRDTSGQHVWAFLGDGETRRARNARRDHAGRAREARQPDLRHQLQPAAARRPGARQRQDHSGAGRHLPRRRLERHQGHLGRRAGIRCWPRTSTACWSSGWAKSSTASIRSTPSCPATTFASTSSASIPSWRRWCEPLSDEELQEAAPRRARSGKGLRRLQGGRRDARASRPSSWPRRSRATAWAKAAKAATSRISRRSSTRRSCASSAPASAFPISDDEVAQGAVLQAGRRQRGDEVSPGAPRGAGRLRARSARPSRCAARCRGSTTISEFTRGQRRPRGVDHDGLRRLSDQAAPGQERSASTSCRSCPTNRAPSAWKACSASAASTRTPASSTSRSIREHAAPTIAKRRTARLLEEGITEAGSMSSFIAAGTAYCHARRQHDSVLHLLLDVRLPADRRPDLGRRATRGPRAS